MKIKRSTGSGVAEADMTPMIDMVFQLIIFFMLVMNIEQAQADERIKLPSDPLATARKDVRKQEVVINIGFVRNSDGTTVGDPLVMTQESGEISVMDYARTYLPREAALIKAVGGAKAMEEASLSIRADGEVPTGLVQELIKAGQEHGFTKFAMKAKSGEE